jgi:hypothetical protein
LFLYDKNSAHKLKIKFNSFLIPVCISLTIVTLLFVIPATYSSTVEQLNKNNVGISDSLFEPTYRNSTEDFVMGKMTDIPIGNNNDGVYILWEEKQNGNSDIMFTKRTAEGFTFKINLSNSPDAHSTQPNMHIDGSNIYFTWWENYKNGSQVPVLRATSDSGITFGGITQLSKLPTTS